MQILHSLYIAFIFVFLACIITHIILCTPKMRKKALIKARKAGHKVKASRYNCYSTYVVYSEKMNNKYYGRYYFVYQSKEYVTEVKSIGNAPPQELTLYFTKNPQKAKPSKEIKFDEPNWFLIYIGFAILLYLIQCCIH